VGGEDQLKALIRQAFSEKNVADRALLDVDALLGRVMLNVRRLVETLPEESLLRGKAWRELEPLVKIEMEPYAQGLQRAVMQEEAIAAPGMEAFARRQAEYAGAAITQGLGGTTPASVAAQVNRVAIGRTRFKQLFAAKDGISPYTQSMFRVVDRKVRAGIIEGLTTQEIAGAVVHETISRGVPGVSLRGVTSVRTIRAQAMAMARTVTADLSRQVREDVYGANREAMKGMVYQFSSALDSRTCPTCAALDGQRWDNEQDAPVTPIHPNCRCQVLAIDPEDPFWGEQRRNGQQLSTKPYTYKGKPIDKLSKAEKAAAKEKGHYVTKTKVKGEQFYRKAVTFKGDSYSDYLASSNLTTQAEFFGGGAVGMRRARYFRDQIDKVNKDPRDILVSMLNGPTEARKFIPLP
jgi:SPP1 gp7 family putative phage head morphogenesis protein